MSLTRRRFLGALVAVPVIGVVAGKGGAGAVLAVVPAPAPMAPIDAATDLLTWAQAQTFDSAQTLSLEHVLYLDAGGRWKDLP